MSFDVGTFGTVTGAAVGITTTARLLREKRRRERLRKMRAKKRWKTNRRTKRKFRG